MCKCTGKCESEACVNHASHKEPQFKVGDRVYSLVSGWGIVENHSKSKFVLVRHSPTRITYYDQTGNAWNESEGEQVLFHDKPTIIPAKKKVKKWIWAFRNSHGHTDTTMYHVKTYSPIAGDAFAVKLPWTEIEEEEDY